ncbi:MAG: ABC transporter substrate-binding protein [Dehalococcoidia bacterium]
MKNTKLGLLILLSLTLIVIPLASACGTTTPPDEELPKEELKIGAIFALSGPFSGPLMQLRDGVVACADWINDNGGLTVQGEQYLIKIIDEDNKLSPDGAITAANKLIYQDKVEFMVGPIIPFLSAAVAPVTEEANVLRCQINGVGMPGELSPDMTYTFTTFFSRGAVAPTFDYFVEAYPDLNRVALTCPEDPGGLFNMELAKEAAEALDLEVVFMEAYPFDTVDFYPLMTSILATNPDAVSMGEGMGPQYAGIVKAARELGFTGPLFAYSSTGDTEAFRDMIGTDFAYDIFVNDEYLASPEMPAMVREVEEYIMDKYGQELTANHLYGWDALWYMAQAIEAAQSLDPAAVAATWTAMASLESVFGASRMGGLETYGINHVVSKVATITRLENGEIEIVKWYEMYVP